MCVNFRGAHRAQLKSGWAAAERPVVLPHSCRGSGWGLTNPQGGVLR